MSLYDSIRNAPDGERRIAAAEARYAALRLLRSSLLNSGLSKSQLAKRLGLGKSAVGHVLNGNGNVRISTLSDYLHEAGMKLRLVVEPISSSQQRRPAVPRSYSTVECKWGNADGIWSTKESLPHGSGDVLLSIHPASVEPVRYETARQQVTESDEISDALPA